MAVRSLERGLECLRIDNLMLEPSPILAFGPYVLNASARQLLRDGEPVTVTPKAFDVLCLLARNAGRTVPKTTLLSTVWPDGVVDENNLAFQISVLRKALSDSSGGSRHIVTVPGQGYQLVTPVRVLAADDLDLVLEERERTMITIEAEPSRRSAPRALLIAAALAIVVLGGAFLLRIRQDGAQAAPPIRTVAVLPFKSLLAAQADEALELGMADALISRISTNPDVIVRPLASVRRFTGQEEDPIAAGKALGADAVLDGSIVSADGRIRVSARLLRVSDASQVWTGQFEERSSEIFAIQDSISARLARDLSWNLRPSARPRRETVNPEAYRAYAVGRLHATRVQSVANDKAIASFKRAIALDPNYAAAWMALADCYAIQPISADRPPRENFQAARAAITKAIELDPDVPDAHAVLGVIRFWYDWDWAGAEAAYQRAIEVSPTSATSHIRYAHLLSNTGRHEEAEREAREALRLDPLSPHINFLAAQFRLQAGDVVEAVRQLRHVLSLHPDLWQAHLNLGKAYEMMGRYDDALRELAIARESSGENVEPHWMIGYVHARRGDRMAARKALDELLAIQRRRYVPPAKIALLHIGMGNHDEAFRWLTLACEDRDRTLVFLDVNPRFRALHADPRFEAVRRCVNLPR
jgi:DNA-binding winged helix-turn-helix (wHTH) protein/tetratricopeptide (TPR) repeat protein/TolB-like protein